MRASHGIGQLPASANASTLRKPPLPALAAAARSYGAVVAAAVPAEDAWLSCGTVQVPLNRADPHDPRRIGIHVELSLHSAPGPPKGVIVLEAGGPARPSPGPSAATSTPCSETCRRPSTSSSSTSAASVRAKPSTALTWSKRSPQDSATPPPGPAATASATGHSCSRHAPLPTTSKSVRTALGVDKINLFGNSYAGNDVVTYAVRHRAHVRSVVTTSAELTPGEDTFWGSVPRPCRASPAPCVPARRPVPPPSAPRPPS